MLIWLDTENKRALSYDEQVAALEEIALASDVHIEPSKSGFAVSTRLYLLPAKRWQRTSSTMWSEANGRFRKVNAVCWHGHYRFMSELFKRFPHARVKTASFDYQNRKDFIAYAENTGISNIGSMMSPMRFADACLCDQDGDNNPEVYDALYEDEHAVQFGTIDSDGHVYNVRLIKQSSIAACPHFIVVAEHYREDGSCKCNDPSDENMKTWGYNWNGERWV